MNYHAINMALKDMENNHIHPLDLEGQRVMDILKTFFSLYMQYDANDEDKNEREE